MKASKKSLLFLIAALAALITACSSSGSSTTSSSGGSASSPSSGSASGQAAPSKSPIVIANVAARTGPISSTGDEYYGLDAWVKTINASGGIDGHPVQLYGADSKGDPTAETNAFQTLAAQYHPVAFVGVGTFNMGGDLPTVEKTGIPVIGGNTGDTTWYQSSLLYPPSGSFVTQYYGMVADAPSNAKKIGQLYCTVASGCIAQNKILNTPGVVSSAGGQLVFSREITLDAPNYTAVCLAAKQAGVQSLIVGSDGNTLVSLANNCASQGFNPTYIYSGLLSSTQFLSAPSLQGSIGILSTFPPFVSDAATAAYRTAMTKYENPSQIDVASTQGWVAGEMFGLAANEALALGPLTTSSLESALGKVKNETLGGLIPPTTFIAGQPAPVNLCFFEQTIVNGKWVAPAGLSTKCAPASLTPTLASLSRKL